MAYQSLKKIYYVSPDTYENEYIKRFQSPFSQHISIMIHQYHRKSSYPAFFNYTNDILLLLEKVYKTYEKFLYVVHSVPPVVCHQFILLSILDEVKSTNDIEGVHSTRKELRDILDGAASQSERFTSIVNKYHELITNSDIPFNNWKISDIFLMNLRIKKSSRKTQRINWMAKYLEKILSLSNPPQVKSFIREYIRNLR